MNKPKSKRGGRSSRGNGRGGGAASRQHQAKPQPEPEPVMDTTAATPPPPSAGGEYAQQVDEDGKQVGKYKTKLCVFNASPQGCPYGTECLFAHGTDELRPDLSGRKAPSSSVQQNPLYKTKLCVHWSTSGGKFCPHSTRCVFAHGMHELRAIGARPDGADAGPSSAAAPATDAPHATAEAAAKAARRALTMAGRSGVGPPPLHSGEGRGHPGTPPPHGTPASAPPSPIVSMGGSYSSASPPGGAPSHGMYAPPTGQGMQPPAAAQLLAMQQQYMQAQAQGGMGMQAQMHFMQQMAAGHMQRYAPHMVQQQGASSAYSTPSGYPPVPQPAPWGGGATGAAPQQAAAMRSRCLKFLGEISELQGGVAAMRLGALRKEDPALFASVQDTAARLGQHLPALSPAEPSAERDSPPMADAFSTHLGGGHSAPAGLHGGTPLSLSSLGEPGVPALGTTAYGMSAAAAPWGSTHGSVWGEPPSSTPPPQEAASHLAGIYAAPGAFGDVASSGGFGLEAFGAQNGSWSAPAVAAQTSSQPSSALGGGWDEAYLGAGAFEGSNPTGVWGH